MLIKTSAETFSEDQIIDILQARDKTIRIEKVDKIYYPYAMMMYSVKMKKGLMSKLDKLMMCNIDMVYGRPAIGQGKPTFIELEIEDVMAVPPQVAIEKLDSIGHDYVLKMFLSKMKILQTPTLSVDHIEYFHKLFYVVHCKDAVEQDYFVMVDSMDGNLAILDY